MTELCGDQGTLKEVESWTTGSWKRVSFELQRHRICEEKLNRGTVSVRWSQEELYQ